MSQSSKEETYLSSGVARLEPLLSEVGFKYVMGDSDISSGGSFASGRFLREDRLEIGLIIRNDNQLGCPNYTAGEGIVGHDDLLWAFGREHEAKLVPGDFFATFVAKDGSDPLDAFIIDIRNIVIPELKRSETAFFEVLARAFKRLQDERGF